MDLKAVALILIAILIIVAPLVYILNTPDVGVPVDSSDIKASYIEIDGMTCLHHYDKVFETAVLTCNWDEWKGRGS